MAALKVSVLEDKPDGASNVTSGATGASTPPPWNRAKKKSVFVPDGSAFVSVTAPGSPRPNVAEGGWKVPTSVCATSGDVTTMRRVTDFSGSSSLDPQVLNILWRSPELHYTGDVGNLLYPDDVDPAHPEFEER